MIRERLGRIEGLDVDQGEMYCGAWEIYEKALRDFSQDSRERAAALEEAIQEADTARLSSEAHALKSVVMVLGAAELSELAAEVEQTAKKGDLTTVIDKTKEMAEQCRRLGQGLADAFAAQEAEEKNVKATEQSAAAEQARAISSCRLSARTLLLIEGEASFLVSSIANNLHSAGFRVITVPAELGRIEDEMGDAAIILFYLRDASNTTIHILNRLLELREAQHRTICLLGEAVATSGVCAKVDRALLDRVYERPVHVRDMAKDLSLIAETHREYERTKTIILVDDDPAYLNILHSWLSGSYNAFSFTGGQEAMQYLAKGKPDLILLDYEMPEPSGYELLQQIREIPATSELPVIFLTGKGDRESVMKVLDCKPNGYILKSVTRDDLLNKLDDFFVERILRSTEYIPPEQD